MPNHITNTELRELLNKYLRGNASVEEVAFVEEYYAYFDKDMYNPEVLLAEEQRVLGEKIFFQLSKKIGQEAIPTADLEPAVNDLRFTPSSSVHRIHFLKTAWFRYAAMLLLIVGAVTFLYLFNQPSKESAQTILTEPRGIHPGSNKAILTLADGSTIILDSAVNGQLASQGNTRIVKLDAGALAYSAGAPTGEVLYNTIATPRGGQYQIVLPDGSKVWLNAESSIKFPTSFSHNRKVEVTGEVYFEIAPARDLPFFVNTKGTEIQVLGTAFNMNAYQDEDFIKTTLLEGNIKVLEGKNEKILQPGQQAISQAGMGIQVKNADVSVETAWKNGIFQFNESDIKSIMRQLARWYDIEVEYRGEVKDRFVGEMPRDKPISQILEMLGKTELVKFTITGKKVIVE